MNNKWLIEMSQKPILSTLRLSLSMLWSNKLIFILVTVIYILLTSMSFLIPFTVRGVSGDISITLMIIVSVIISLFSQLFTISNYLYIDRLVLDSDNKEACIAKMATTKTLPLFFDFFKHAIASSLAIAVIVLPLIFVREGLNAGKLWDIFLIVLLVLALYVYPIVMYKITLSHSFKEAFKATFSIFSPSVWRQSLHIQYAKFVISLMLILIGIYSLLVFIIETISDIGNDVLGIPFLLLMMIFSIFFTLYVLPVSMMIAQSIKTDD